MDNDRIGQLIQGIGLFTELWSITYHSFKSQGISDQEAIAHTSALMSVIFNSAIGLGNGE